MANPEVQSEQPLTVLFEGSQIELSGANLAQRFGDSVTHLAEALQSAAELERVEVPRPGGNYYYPNAAWDSAVVVLNRPMRDPDFEGKQGFRDLDPVVARCLIRLAYLQKLLQYNSDHLKENTESLDDLGQRVQGLSRDLSELGPGGSSQPELIGQAITPIVRQILLRPHVVSLMDRFKEKLHKVISAGTIFAETNKGKSRLVAAGALRRGLQNMLVTYSDHWTAEARAEAMAILDDLSAYEQATRG